LHNKLSKARFDIEEAVGLIRNSSVTSPVLGDSKETRNSNVSSKSKKNLIQNRIKNLIKVSKSNEKPSHKNSITEDNQEDENLHKIFDGSYLSPIVAPDESKRKPLDIEDCRNPLELNISQKISLADLEMPKISNLSEIDRKIELRMESMQ
jgi:type I site-specific restriction endonuclease